MLGSTSTNILGAMKTLKMKRCKGFFTVVERSFNYTLVFPYSNKNSRRFLYVMNHVIQYTTAEQFEASTQHIPAL